MVGHSINSGLDTFSDKKKTMKTANHQLQKNATGKLIFPPESCHPQAQSFSPGPFRSPYAPLLTVGQTCREAGTKVANPACTVLGIKGFFPGLAQQLLLWQLTNDFKKEDLEEELFRRCICFESQRHEQFQTTRVRRHNQNCFLQHVFFALPENTVK